jgi:hypothetical protein
MNRDLKRYILVLATTLALTVPLSGCKTFSIDTPAEMAQVPARVDRSYDYRATTPHGVVIGVRTHRQGDGAAIPAASHDFWLEAMRERMRTMGGYALLSEEPITSANGHKGTLLKFGRDVTGASYYYWVSLFVTDDYIHVIDATGERERFEAAEGVIKKALASYRVHR